ncbi:MAG: cysteine--tRNA ligase [Nitrospirota bacterium]
MLKIYNTITGEKEVFEPIRSGMAGMYVCGITVYDYCHLGHARSAIIFDVIRRYLQFRGLSVRYIRNFTDVDDKIIKRANEEKKGWQEIADRYIEEYYKDMDMLKVYRADVEPKATEHIKDIVNMVKGIMDKGYAYKSGGDIFFSIDKFPLYGRLSHKKIKDLLAGARVEIDKNKANPLDFVLWKASKEGEPSWDSPWGRGRPGWHIECSAMSMKYLGASFDIHGGGRDLIFPHHENEIAQSEAFSSQQFVRYWIHNGFVTIDQEKMSKSLGNFFTIREIFEKSPCLNDDVTAESLRYFLLSTHYRKPIDFSDMSIEAGRNALKNIYIMLQKLDERKSATLTESSEIKLKVARLTDEYRERFVKTMDDDFNTAEAIGEINILTGEVNKIINGLSAESADRIKKLFTELGEVLGLFKIPIEMQHFGERSHGKTNINSKEIERLIIEREMARKNRDWKKADSIRMELSEKGIILEDRPDGTTRIRR